MSNTKHTQKNKNLNKQNIQNVKKKWQHSKIVQAFFNIKLKQRYSNNLEITPQRYAQIVTGKFAWSVFVFPSLKLWKCNNFAKKRYFSKIGQIWRELSSPCQQKCPYFNPEIEIQAVYPIIRAP